MMNFHLDSRSTLQFAQREKSSRNTQFHMFLFVRGVRPALNRGKARANPHKWVDHSDETTPVVTVDYCFMNSRADDVVMDEKTHAPILVVRDRWTKHLFANVLPYKGVTKGPYGSKVLLNDIKKLGYSKLIIRHDPQPALTSVVEGVKNGFEGTLIIEKSPKGLKESKGEIERAVQTLEGQARTL